MAETPHPAPEAGQHSTTEWFEIRRDAKGSLDEIVAQGATVHLERMDTNAWFLNVIADGKDHAVWFRSSRKMSVYEEDRTPFRAPLPFALASHPLAATPVASHDGDLVRDKAGNARTADGSMAIGEVVAGVMDLFPGADRQALQCLAELLSKPTTPPAPDAEVEALALVKRLEAPVGYGGHSSEDSYEKYDELRLEAATALRQMAGQVAMWRESRDTLNARRGEDEAALDAAEVRIAELTTEMRRVKAAIEQADPDVLTCTLWMHDTPAETVVDFISAALARTEKSEP